MDWDRSLNWTSRSWSAGRGHRAAKAALVRIMGVHEVGTP